jgi:phage shock protein B
MHDLTGLIAVVGIFVIFPAVLVLHYVTKWKTAPRLTDDDEGLLDELYQVARRLDERMDTVERLVAAEHPEFNPSPLRANLESDNLPLDEFDRLRGAKERTRR